MFGRARLAVAAIRSFGVGWVLFRLRYALARRLGLIERRSPVRAWSTVSLAHWLTNPRLAEPTAYHDYRRRGAPAFFFAARDRARYAPLLTAFDTRGGDSVAAADRLATGAWTWFGAIDVQASMPPDWHMNPLTGQRAPAYKHWSRLSDFAFGDIKAIWEPSRFGAAYLLVRAAWRSGDDRYAELFWRLVEDWREHNPPARGANWKCGQEASFRVMAWCFALYALVESPTSSPARIAMLGAMIAESGARIEANLAYALSQFNNHGISEGVGLFTIGTLFPEFRDASRWAHRGREVLESLGRDLIYDDGAFSQHSLNYHRVMLHDYLWALRLAELNGRPLSGTLRARVERAATFLYNLQDECTGRVPVYGANDSSLILPLSNCDPNDYRPVVQAAAAVIGRGRVFVRGPWDEECLWLAGPDVPSAGALPPERTALRADNGGYYTLRTASGFAFVRCARFAHRPGHSDQLHVDLWWRGENVALDPGTFGYNSDLPWAAQLEGTACHNTVTVDGRDQADRVSRFLSYPWSEGRVRSACDAATATPAAYWEGEHSAYSRLRTPVRHQRAVAALADDAWLVVDHLSSAGPHNYRVHWLLPDAAHEWDSGAATLRLHLHPGKYHVRMGCSAAGATASLVRADGRSARGWRAPGYGRLEPALAMVQEVRAADAWCWTLFSAGPCSVAQEGLRLSIAGADWKAEACVQAAAPGALVTVVVEKPVVTVRATNGEP